MRTKWFIALAVIAVAFVAAIYLGIFHGAAADSAKAALLKDPAVIERCGTEIEVEPSFVGRSYVRPGGSREGSARLRFRCGGSKGLATVTVILKQLDGVWSATEIAVDP
jgi:hypothetical protein